MKVNLGKTVGNDKRNDEHFYSKKFGRFRHSERGQNDGVIRVFIGEFRKTSLNPIHSAFSFFNRSNIIMTTVEFGNFIAFANITDRRKFQL